MKEILTHYFNRYADFSDSEIEQIQACLTVKNYKDKSYLLEAGQICNHNYFILEGLVRTFYIEDGVEHITQFAIENWWVTNMDSFRHQTPSLQNIQAVGSVQAALLDRMALNRLYQEVPKLERAFRIISENMLIAFQRKSDFFMKKSGEERYTHLVSSLPKLIQRVPQYMIASYLQMTPEHLSSLRKKK